MTDDAPPEVDHAWVLEATFVTTVVAGAPLVAAVALLAGVPPTWEGRVGFAVRVGAAVWLTTALALYAYDRWWR